ncbi:MAG: YggS family pyridoxal phosphate-dependent enzyme [Verrucomicrobiota bacterium]
MPDIEENLARVKNQLADAAAKANRNPSEIELLVVSKTWPAETVQQVFDAGQTLFGENRVQEAIAKIPLLSSKLEWHLIGHLQKNKIRKALPLFDTLHSIDSLELAQQTNRIAGELGLFPKVYLEVNVAAEASKHGFTPVDLTNQIDELLNLERLQIEGLMAIPPFDPDPENTRPHFVSLRKFRDQLQTQTGVPLPKLSMGMSHDYPVAIEEGATIVRVGSAIFGPRKQKKATP